ncbi:serine/threonine/tyrosine-interacting-like protein 1 isoform X2 [Anguilla anguilla]|uniref:serine/threonine/tyrosine-interacting-like protein 1 isoform X2 n=1 Tax=Anguilla anguilla TaxID=7936 RepID=UPI0015A965FB|nr:serine/threonine/tyrosine-interacting-like protein 1 isoform X2 [Anguilla anguilla]
MSVCVCVTAFHPLPNHSCEKIAPSECLPLETMGAVLSRVPHNSWQPMNSAPYRETNGTGNNLHCPALLPAPLLTQDVYKPGLDEVLIPLMPEKKEVERGYVTPQQVYNLLNAEAGEPALFDPNYILILDCRSAERYKESHLVTARASVTVMHPELGCLISCVKLQEFSIILLYAEEGQSPVGSEGARADSPTLQRCFFQLSAMGMDPVILLGGYSAFHPLYPFLCTPNMVLLEPERRALSIYPSEILEGALYQGSASQAQDFRILKNLCITHVVNATAECPDSFPSMLRYLRLRLSDDAQQDLSEALPLAARFIAAALEGGAGRVLVHCSLGRGRSSVLTLGFLMEHRRWSLLHAFRWLKERRPCVAPNASFLRQLCAYEERLFGSRLTAPEDLRL